MAGKPQPSSPFGPPGKRLWRAVLHDYDLAKHELVLLESACRMADHVAALDAQVAADGLVVQGSQGQPRLHPAAAALPAARAALSRLIRDLGLPPLDDPDVEPKSSEAMSRSEQASRASRARWARAKAGAW